MDSPTGIIVNYHIAYTKEVLVNVSGIYDKKKAGKLIGKKAIWTSPEGKKWIGKVTGLHGRKGTIKVKFKKPLPANSLATKINIAE
ncbi:MAG: 50S ribosomal protein L35ae [Candidatus Aenigmarchaeota archaeon]|nr:50S ribosomal protein L35ae [Candidatus Aenigmarchaeota archaeon]